MTIQKQIEALETLAALDAELGVLNEALNQEREGLTSKQSQLSSLDERYERGRKGVEEMEKSRNDLVGELRQMNFQVERSREKLPRCRTEREANAVQRELEELRKLVRDREQEIEKIEALLTQARDESTRLSSQRQNLSGELGSQQGEVMSRLATSEQSVSEKNAVRAGLVKQIDPQLYRRYELIRTRRGSAIAHTSNGTCSACHMQLQPMLFQKLMRADAFGQCPSCNRILYYRPAVPGEVENSSESP
ncbi:MAG TPA: C4-type zinc ribbon domain-containing protein [Polyangiaceae bacterium]|nr:C4-type zinc ribbon domain-containing protein [Polyangiaceae bacterium]